ncbi:MAG TPA: helix-turn-helix domain-containing protein [Microvirga sp.]|jgi:AraC family transcriptional regulator|nr:helix-turn-helix domain-containing protein [Microvirga sp.]
MIEMTVARERRIAADGEPTVVLPEWGGTVRSEWTTFILHPPIDFELSYEVDRYVAFLPFGTASSDLSIGGGPLVRTRLRAGTVLFVEPGTCVRVKQAEPIELLVLSIDPERVRLLGEVTANGGPWHARTIGDHLDPAISALAEEMRRSMLADQLSQPVYLQSLADALLVRLHCHFLGEVDRGAARGEALSPGRLARIVRHVDQHLDGTIRVEELAAIAGLTRSHFSRAFQRMTGDPPKRFILKRRVCRARDLLSGGEARIAEIAVRTGFSSQAHLSTTFAKEVGTTPARYRAAFKRDG